MLEKFYNTYKTHYFERRMKTRTGLTFVPKMERHLNEMLMMRINDENIVLAEVYIKAGDGLHVPCKVNGVKLKNANGDITRYYSVSTAASRDKYTSTVIEFWAEVNKELWNMHEMHASESAFDGTRYVDYNITAEAKRASRLYGKVTGQFTNQKLLEELYEEHNAILKDIVLDYVYDMLDERHDLPFNMLINLEVSSPIMFTYKCGYSDFPLIEYKFLEFKTQDGHVVYKVRWIEDMAVIEKIRGEIDISPGALRQLEMLFSLIGKLFNDKVLKEFKSW